MKNTQDNFRVLNYNGKEYRFNYVAFGDILAEKSAASKTENGKKRISQSAWMNKISEALDISPEAVKNWKRGYNGPKDTASIRKCAEVLGVDVLSLLRPLDHRKEIEKMNESEKRIIEEVFFKCVSALYVFSERFKTDKKEKDGVRNASNEAKKLLAHSIEEIHCVVDRSALFIGESVRYRLHRLLNDFCEIGFCEPIPDRWEKIEESVGDHVDAFSLRFCFGNRDRESLRDNVWYITEEQELAEKLNYSYTSIPERYYENVDSDGIPLDEKDAPIPMEKFGITDACAFEITPSILYKDMMTRLLKDVFLHDFPELENGTQPRSFSQA